MAIKLLIADVDGTLVNRKKVLTPGTCEAVQRLRDAGVLFTLTSGRPPRGMAALIAPLQLTAPIAAFNGGMYVKPDLTTVLAQRTIPSPVARQAVDFLLRAGLDVWVYQGNDWFLRDPGAFRVDRERSNVGFEPVVIDDLHAVLDAAIKIVGVSQDTALITRCEAELGERLQSEASAARSTPYYLDVTNPEANKGMVVREASRLLHIPLEEIATIGDMSNDIPMLTAAGIGIAMGNAGEDVQRVARYVTGTNEEEGFARAVDAFILGNPPAAQSRLGLPPRTRACIFGLDGVLTQAADLQARAWKELFDHHLRERRRALGEPFIPFELIHDYSTCFEGRLALEGIRAFLTSRGIDLPDGAVHALARSQGERLVKLLEREQPESYEGSIRYLEAARAAGIRTAAVSASRHGEEILEAASMDELLDAQRHPLDDAAEPAPGLYLAAAKLLGVDAADAVVFEHEPAAIAAARLAHFGYIVGVDRRGRAAELRSSGADVVVSDLDDLVEGERHEAPASDGFFEAAERP